MLLGDIILATLEASKCQKNEEQFCKINSAISKIDGLNSSLYHLERFLNEILGSTVEGCKQVVEQCRGTIFGVILLPRGAKLTMP